jgi:aryl-alcohol dehydrogenase-like predicted oxidoreductase
MDRTTLGGRETSRIGFGCGRLAGAVEKRTSIRLIEQVRTLGISHFDVAPSYGFGLAEDVLGEALAGDGAVTITTKVGTERPSYGHLKSAARYLLRPLLSSAPAFRRTLGIRGTDGSRRSFAPDLVEASVAESLRRLKRESVDALLLHEPPADGVTPALAATMEKFVVDGRAGAVGTGTSTDLGQLVPFGTVRQYRWSQEAAPQEDHRDIVHGILRRYPRPKSTSAEWKEHMRSLGFDPADPASWPGLLLTFVLGTMPNAIVLVSSTSASRISEAVGAINWPAARGDRSGVLAGTRALLTNTAA